MVIVARLWADQHRDCDPLAVIEIERATLELVTPDDYGLTTVWQLRSRYIPAPTSGDNPTADYELMELR